MLPFTSLLPWWRGKYKSLRVMQSCCKSSLQDMKLASAFVSQYFGLKNGTIIQYQRYSILVSVKWYDMEKIFEMLGFGSLSPSELLTLFKRSIHSFIFLFFNIVLRPCFPHSPHKAFCLGSCLWSRIICWDTLLLHSSCNHSDTIIPNLK